MHPVPLRDWEESLRHIVAAMDGQPLNVHALLANHPALLNAWWPLRQYLVKGGDLEQRECELVILRIASREHSWYEWASHVIRGLDSGLSPGEIAGVRRDDTHWDERDSALLSAVDDIVSDNRIKPTTLERLATHYSDQQILDIIHLYGMYATIACLASTWDLELDEQVAQSLPATETPEAFDARPQLPVAPQPNA